MERAHTVARAFDNNEITIAGNTSEENHPVDKLKLSSGDMFMGSDPKEIALVNEFLNFTGIIAIALGNHDCDSPMLEFVKQIQAHNYKIVSTNIHPDTNNPINSIRTGSFIVEVNGNKYGVIGSSPIDLMKHAKVADVSELHVDDLDATIKEIKTDINEMKKNKVNKIILLSHMGIDIERHIAQNVNDIDIILGGPTHTLFNNIEEGQNLYQSPKGEPVVIIQSGKDGEHIGALNVKFNEQGQITEINHEVINTDNYKRSPSLRAKFDEIIEPVKLGEISYVGKLPENLYIVENQNCDFILDNIRSELNTDIAVMNASVTRNTFSKGNLELRDLKSVFAFKDSVRVVELSEGELVSMIQERAKKTMTSLKNKPGLLQVSGLKYTINEQTGDLLSLEFIDKNGTNTIIDITNPTDKTYRVAIDEFCAKTNGQAIEKKYSKPLEITNLNASELTIRALKKQTQPIQIKTDGRIKIVSNKKTIPTTPEEMAKAIEEAKSWDELRALRNGMKSMPNDIKLAYVNREQLLRLQLSSEARGIVNWNLTTHMAITEHAVMDFDGLTPVMRRYLARASELPDLDPKELEDWLSPHFYDALNEDPSYGTVDDDKNNALSRCVAHTNKAIEYGKAGNTYAFLKEVGYAIHYLQDGGTPPHTDHGSYLTMLLRIPMHTAFEKGKGIGASQRLPILKANYTYEDIPFSSVEMLFHNTALFTVQPENQVKYTNSKEWFNIQQRCYDRCVNVTKTYLKYIMQYLPKSSD